MRKRVLAIVLATLGLTAGASALAGATDTGAPKVISIATHQGGPTSQRLVLSLNKAAIVELDADSRDVLVSNPEILDAVVRTPRRIFLLANKTGQTNAFFFDKDGHQLLSLDVRVEQDVVDLSSMIRASIPDSDVKVESMNDNVVLTGTVPSTIASTRAQTLAARFAGSPDKVVNMLQITGGQQVMLKVRVAEMQRDIAKQFGVNIASAQFIGGVPLALSSDNQFALLGRALSDLSGGQAGQVCENGANPLAGGTCVIGPNNVQGTLKTLERVGLLHTLAEPNLTAVSGETAKFLAGGEFPVPASRDRDGNITVDYKQFGVGLSFTPVVLSSGKISLQISTEVSELTNTGAFTLQGGSTTDSNGQTVTTGGLTIPALAVRRAETTVELPSGGSFAIAGLMQHTTKQTIDAFPGLKDMPVLGALFRSRDYQNNETELVVLVSAFLVNPTTEMALASPTDGFVTPSDVDTILNGRLNTVYDHKSGTAKTSDGSRPGFIVR